MKSAIFCSRSHCPFADPYYAPLVASEKTMRSSPTDLADLTDFWLSVDVELTDIDGKQAYRLCVTMTIYNLQIEQIVVGVVAKKVSISLNSFNK
jgi:hypothetical protein